MISALLVEDNTQKAEKIIAVLKDATEDQIAITVATTASDGAARLKEHSFDLLLLDLNIPMRSGEAPSAEGGINLLQSIKSRHSYKTPAHIIGITEFDALLTAHQEEFVRELWLAIKFDPSSSEWSAQLKSRLAHILNGEARAKQLKYDYDVAILTALHSVELEAVLKLPADWKELRKEGDPTIYYSGVFGTATKTLRVVAASAIEMGMPAASAQAMKMIVAFRPRVIAMCGIAAGVEGRFGDILIADRCWDYGSGKQKRPKGARQSKFLPAPTQISISAHMQESLATFCLTKDVFRGIRVGWTDLSVSPGDLGHKIGPFASGAAVLEDRKIINRLVRQQRKVIGVEMETYGVFMAAKVSPEPRPEVIAVKSICDFGAPGKNDKYQRYAAYTSAQFVFHFSLSRL